MAQRAYELGEIHRGSSLVDLIKRVSYDRKSKER
jgi:hypothetical protein